MLSRLKRLILDLSLDQDKFRNYGLVATSFFRFDKSKNDFVGVDMPKNEQEFNSCKKVDKPVFEIVIDANDPELCLITKYLPEKKASIKPMKFSCFYNKIFGLPERYQEYEVLSSSWEHLSDGDAGRVDIPIVAVAVDEENDKICLVEMASE